LQGKKKKKQRKGENENQNQKILIIIIIIIIIFSKTFSATTFSTNETKSVKEDHSWKYVLTRADVLGTSELHHISPSLFHQDLFSIAWPHVFNASLSCKKGIKFMFNYYLYLN